MTEPTPIDRRIATITTVVLVTLGSGVFLAGAISAADTLLASDPEDRALSREGAVLAVQVVQAPSDDSDTSTSDRPEKPKDPHTDRHRAAHRGTPVPAQVTVRHGDLERTFRTDDRGFVHLELRSGDYGLTVTTRMGTDATDVDVKGLTHVRAEVADDGTITFLVEHHRPHHPPFRPPASHDASSHDERHDAHDAPHRDA